MTGKRERGTPADLGVLAAIGLAVCCGLPLLVGAGVLTTVGAVLRNPIVIAGGVAALAWFAWRPLARRRRAARCATRSADPDRR